MQRTSFIHWVLLTMALVLFTPTRLASAEDYVPASSGKRFTPVKGPGLRFIAGATFGVPIFFNVDRDVVRPGADMYGWLGLDIGWVVFAAGFGASWNPIDLGEVPGGEGLGKSPLTRLYITPEIRLQVPKAKAVLPYLSGAFDANWWKHREVESFSCNRWYCSTRARFQFAPGFTGKVGMGIKVGERIYLDVGMKYSFTGAGNFFDATQWWLTPFLGFMYRSDAG
jgi:hypothetical protein